MKKINNLIRIQDYVYERKSIGKGSFSKVYKGTNVLTKMSVAIKKINKSKLDDNLHDRLNTEIKFMKQYSHKNIINLYDVLHSKNNNYIFIIMEYCSDNDLHNFMKNNKMGEESIKYYMKQLKDGLQYLMQNQILHRDIKPKNILLTNNCTILKIADFGFAKKIVNKISLIDTLCGSPLYMAPEIINDKKYTIQSDLWSVGIILYEMIYEKHPYGKPLNILDLMNRINSRIIDFHDADISNNCMELTKSLLKLDVDERISWNQFFNHNWFTSNNYDNEIDNYSSSDDSMIFEMDETINHSLLKNNNCVIDTFEIIDQENVPYVGSLPTKYNTHNVSDSVIILGNNIINYLSSSFGYN